MTSLGELLAGLGLLFVGLKLLSANLQQALGGRIRVLLQRATASPLAGFLVGCVAGIVTQSSNAVAVISGNLVRGRALTTRDAIPIVAGGNVGTAALVVMAAIDFHLAALMLVGLVGLGYQAGLDRKGALRDWMGVLLGLALLFLGIDFIKAAPRTVDIDALAAFAATLPPLISLVMGVAVALVTQSSSTAAILALAGLRAGFVELDDCFFLVVGANLGSGIASLVAAGGLSGVGRQLCYIHILVKAIGSGLLLLLWVSAPAFGFDPSLLFAEAGAGEAPASVSMLFLVLQLAGALPVTMLRGLAERFADHFSPPSLEDSVSRPRFIDPAATSDPAGALDLSAREIDDLVARLGSLLPDLDAADVARVTEIRLLWRGGSAVAATTDAFLVQLIGRGLSGSDLEAALGQQARLEGLRSLQDALADFSDVILSFEALPRLAFDLSESLRLMVLQLTETGAGDDGDFEFLIALTADRSEHLNALRGSLATSALGAEHDAQRLLLATSLFERAVWLIHRLAIALRATRVTATASQSALAGGPSSRFAPRAEAEALESAGRPSR